MLDHLLQPWHDVLPWLGSPLARAGLAALSAFVIVLVAGPWLIRLLRARQFVDSVTKGDSKELDRLSVNKTHTPTLGGALLFGAVLIATTLWARWDSRQVLLLIGLVVALALLGLADDVTKMRSGRKGILARQKFLWQLFVSLAAGFYLYAFPITAELGDGGRSEALGTALLIPFTNGFYVALGVWFIPVVALVITGSSNAVNLTDGLDGLAIGCSTLVAGAFLAISLAVSHHGFSSALGLPFVPHAAEVSVFLGALVGGGLGFLWFNCHPAQVFMGDTGSLPLGGVLGLAAVLCKHEVLLVIVGGVLVAEALSVILQVGSFKLWRRRIFRIAPLHHHFQFQGYSETRVTVSFWIAGALLALGSLVTLTVVSI